MVTERLGTDDMQSDRWLHALRADPSPVFTAQLRNRLRAEEPIVGAGGGAWRRPTMLVAAAAVVVAIVTSVPTLRAAVVRFASLFRVVNVIGVPVASNHLDRLKADDLQIDTLIGDHVQVVEDPGPPVSQPSIEAASAAAGMTLATPQWLPDGTRVIEAAVVGERAVRITADSQRLQQVMDALGISDLTVPPGLDGNVIDVRVPPVAMIRYEHQSNRRTRLFQARTPDVAVPDAIDLPALGEIGLRILGLPPAEAKSFAATIDWQTTLVVPVPPNASSFQQVDINGRHGVLIQHQPRNAALTTTIIWSTPDRVFALVSIQGVSDALAMATSVR